MPIIIESNNYHAVEYISDFLLSGGCRLAAGRGKAVRFIIRQSKRMAVTQKRLLINKKLLSRFGTPFYRQEIYLSKSGIFYFYFKFDKALLIFNRQNNTLICYLENISVTARPRFQNIVLMGVWQFILRFYGIYFAHASGIAKANKGILLAGSSGAGKSMLSMKLVSRGYGFLSDDMTGVKNNGDSVRMVFSPEWLGLTANASNLFRDLKDRIERNSSPVSVYFKKIKVPINKIFPDSLKLSVPARMMILLKKIDDGSPRLSRIPKREALSYLIREDIFLLDRNKFPGYSRKHLNALFDLIDQVEMYQLTYPIVRLEEAASLIDKHA